MPRPKEQVTFDDDRIEQLQEENRNLREAAKAVVAKLEQITGKKQTPPGITLGWALVFTALRMLHYKFVEHMGAVWGFEPWFVTLVYTGMMCMALSEWSDGEWSKKSWLFVPKYIVLASGVNASIYIFSAGGIMQGHLDSTGYLPIVSMAVLIITAILVQAVPQIWAGIQEFFRHPKQSLCRFLGVPEN